jgi:LPXTG-motif cell wall-anchored protein
MARIAILEGAGWVSAQVNAARNQTVFRTLAPPSQNIGFTTPVAQMDAAPTSASLSIADPGKSEGVKQGMSGLAIAGIAAALAGAFFLLRKRK